MSNKASSLRSPLGRVRGLGSAKSGTEHWWMQRVTSLALVVVTGCPMAMLLSHAIYGGYTPTVEGLHAPLAAAGVILFLAFGFHHAASGLQVVIEDYVHCECVKTASVIAVKLAAVTLFALGTLAVLKIMFGA